MADINHLGGMLLADQAIEEPHLAAHAAELNRGRDIRQEVGQLRALIGEVEGRDRPVVSEIELSDKPRHQRLADALARRAHDVKRPRAASRIATGSDVVTPFLDFLVKR